MARVCLRCWQSYTMKALLFFFRCVIVIAILTLLSALSSCTGKSNAEDDTFRQAVIDDPVKAQSENEAAKLNTTNARLDSAYGDSTKQIREQH